jgi:hypothetical protein
MRQAVRVTIKHTLGTLRLPFLLPTSIINANHTIAGLHPITSAILVPRVL